MKHLKLFNESNDSGIVKDIMNIIVDDDRLDMEVDLGYEYIFIKDKRFYYNSCYEIYFAGYNPMIRKNGQDDAWTNRRNLNRAESDYLLNKCIEVSDRLKNDMIDFHASVTMTSNGGSYSTRWDSESLEEYINVIDTRHFNSSIYVNFYIK